MNGPVTMYKLKPLVNLPDLELTNTMYRMKNIYSNNFSSLEDAQDTRSPPDVLEQVNKISKKTSSEVENLKRRQEIILKQLNFLKDQMLALRKELTNECTNKTTGQEANKNLGSSISHIEIPHKPMWSGIVGDIVISANPNNPPFSLLAVNQLWPDLLRLHVSCHTHSSIISLPSHLSCFSSLSLTPNPTLHARLVWSNMGLDCEMVISPLSHCPIRGEVNMLRYLLRTASGTRSPILDTQLDHKMDICHKLTHSFTQRDRILYVRALNALLGRAQWLGGEAISVADVAAWSAVKNIIGIELSQNMAQWIARCNASFVVDAP